MSAPFLNISYRNYRGEHSDRSLVPIETYYGHTDYHTEDQWLMKAVDVSDPTKPKVRDFAIVDFNPRPAFDYESKFYTLAAKMGIFSADKTPEQVLDLVERQLKWLMETAAKVKDDDF